MVPNVQGSNCAHWALGGLILVALASSEFSGAGTIVALPISALSTTVAGITETSSKSSEIVIRRRKFGDLLIFLALWLSLLEHVLSAATCARMASATIDYMTKGHLRDWLFGLESHSLGEPWPDVMGLLIIAVTTGLFMLGLENSLLFSILLYSGMFISFLMFIFIGSINVDMKFWNWTEDFHLSGSKRVFLTSAMCSYAFPSTFPKVFKTLACLKYVCFVMVPLICYTVIIFIFTSMSHYREIAGTSIPLVRVFEVRGVEWAVTIMAVCTVYIVCITLTEVIPSMYNLILHLAGNEWKILFPSLLYRNSETGAPVLALFITGSLTSILAFACPISYLVRLLNVCSLSKCAFQSTNALYVLYKAAYSNDASLGYCANIRYEKLDHEKRKKIKKRSQTQQRIKMALHILPSFLRQSTSYVNEKTRRSSESREREDKENLLLNDYYVRDAETVSSESESEERYSPGGSDAENSSSSTDIDTVVQEYRDRLQVASLTNLSEKTPTIASSRTAFVLITVVYLCSISIGLGVFLEQFLLVAISGAITAVACIILLSLRKNKLEESKNYLVNKKFLPLSAILSVIMNVLLTTVLLFDVWHGFVFWITFGIILFCRCDWCSCEGLYPVSSERLKLNNSKLDKFESVEFDDFVLVPS